MKESTREEPHGIVDFLVSFRKRLNAFDLFLNFPFPPLGCTLPLANLELVDPFVLFVQLFQTLSRESQPTQSFTRF